MARKQALVIGLGQFGMALARALTAEDYEVIAVDRARDRVQEASAFVEQAVCLDATDENALARLAPEKRDLAVCAIGHDAREATILVTTLLRQLGVERVISRATDPLIARILRLVGADVVVNPEREYGERFARRLVYAGIRDELSLAPNLIISELEMRPAMRGKSLSDLALPNRFGLTVLAIKTGEDALEMPDPHRPLGAHDVLLVAGRPGAAQALVEEW